MKTYALIIGIPLAVFIQCIYSELYINFRKVRNIMCCILEIVIMIACILGKICHIFSIYLCVEIWLIATGSLIIARIIRRNEEEEPVKDFNKWEMPFIVIQVLVGMVICTIPFMSFFAKYIYVYEVKLSVALYEALGIFIMVFNRATYYAVYRLGQCIFKKKR